MKVLFLSSFLLAAAGIQAQFASISDKDGYVNIRSSASLSNNVQDTLNNGRLVYLYEKQGSFYNTEYYKRGENRNGYVYWDRVKKVDANERVRLTSSPANTEIFSAANVKVTITRQAFVKSKYKLSYYKDAPDQIEKFNGKTGYGRDGGLPALEYKSIQVQVGQQVITLPAGATENLFEPSPGNTEVFYDRAKDILYIQASNGSGAGYYDVIWKIEKGVYKERFVVVGE